MTEVATCMSRRLKKIKDGLVARTQSSASKWLGRVLLLGLFVFCGCLQQRYEPADWEVDSINSQERRQRRVNSGTTLPGSGTTLPSRRGTIDSGSGTTLPTRRNNSSGTTLPNRR